MPFKLIAPKPGRSPFWRVRGTEFGIYLDRSTQTGDRRAAQKFLSTWRDEAQRRSLSGPVTPTFASAAIAYVQAGGDKQYLRQLLEHFGDTLLAEIDQQRIDAAAATLYPDAIAATRNRQVYTPISAVLKRAGVEKAIKRPVGWRSAPRPHWLREEQAMALLGAASATDERLGALLTFLLYAGVRLGEALRLRWEDVDLPRSAALIRQTKNGSPVTVHLPPPATAALANLPGRVGRVFGLSKSGRLYDLLAKAEATAGLNLPPRAAFHVLRHTHAVYRRLYTGADTSALVATGLWKSRDAASVYEHVDVTTESRKSDLFPSTSRKSRDGT